MTKSNDVNPTDKRGGVDSLWIFLLVGKPEKAGLHAIVENHKRHSCETVKIAHHSIFLTWEKVDV